MAVETSIKKVWELYHLQDFKGRISVVAYNLSISVTLSGDADAINKIKIIFEAEMKFTRILYVDTAHIIYTI